MWCCAISRFENEPAASHGLIKSNHTLVDFITVHHHHSPALDMRRFQPSLGYQIAYRKTNSFGPVPERLYLPFLVWHFASAAYVSPLHASIPSRGSRVLISHQCYAQS